MTSVHEPTAPGAPPFVSPGDPVAVGDPSQLLPGLDE